MTRKIYVLWGALEGCRGLHVALGPRALGCCKDSAESLSRRMTRHPHLGIRQARNVTVR